MPPSTGYLLLTFGGPALFLLGQLVFMWRVGAEGLRARAFAVLALGVLAIATSGTSLLAASISATVVLFVVATSDKRSVAPIAAPVADVSR